MLKTLFDLNKPVLWRKWRKQRLLPGCFFIMLSIFVLWGALTYHLYQGSHFYAVYINGQEVGLLADKEMLGQIEYTLLQEASSHYGRPVQPSETVRYEEVFRPLAEESPEKVLSQLRTTQSYKVDALMITVAGRDIFPVADEDVVEEVIATLASAYVPSKENVKLEDVYFQEQIESYPVYCYPEELRDADTVSAILLRGTDRREIYLVSRGDSLWGIAREYDLTIEELREANPQVEGDFLQIGDELSLIVPEPLINVVTKEHLAVTEKIPFQVIHVPDSSMWSGQTKVLEAGVFGSKEVVYEVTRENGQEISREIISSDVTKEPIVQTVARGTASIPARGTGSFIWPVEGGGRLTSPYGWRSGGFHAGIDIGARRGTGIVAADSGVVVYAGWDGAYGNCIVIFHGTYYTRYAHNSENLVSKGQAVNKGDLIGRVGSTGRASGDHLHFEVRTGGIYGSTIDPLNFFKPN